MKKELIFPLLVAASISTIGCESNTGNLGGEQITPVPDDRENNQPQGKDGIWEELSGSRVGVAGFAIAMERSGEDIYFSYNAMDRRNLFSTQDGSSFNPYYTNSTSVFVSFIDERGRIYLDVGYTDNGIDFVDKGEVPFGGYINGNSHTLLAMTSSPRAGVISGSYLKMSNDRALTWSVIDLNSDGSINKDDKVVSSDPAFNGVETFVIPSNNSGLWLSSDLGLTWRNILVEEGKFELVAGNQLFSSRFYAVKKSGIFVSDDAGNSWKKIPPPTDEGAPIVEWIDLELLDDGAIAAWGISIESLDGKGQLFISNDGGHSWQKVGNPIGMSGSSLGNITIQNLEANSNFYFVCYGGRFID